MKYSTMTTYTAALAMAALLSFSTDAFAKPRGLDPTLSATARPLTSAQTLPSLGTLPVTSEPSEPVGSGVREVPAQVTCFLNTAGNQARIRTFINYDLIFTETIDFIDDGYGQGKWLALVRNHCLESAVNLCGSEHYVSSGFNWYLAVVTSVTAEGNLLNAPFHTDCGI